MTPAQQARIQGFKASLAARGVTLQLADGKTNFQALIAHTPASADDFELGPAQRIDAAISVLRSTFTGLGIAEHAHLLDLESRRVWIVTAIEDNPANVAVLLDCKLSDD